MIQVYGIKNCDSVKKALVFLKKNNLEFELHDFKTQPVGCDKVSFWLQIMPIKTLFNAKSTTYRTLGLKEKNLDEEGMADWLCKENLLIKRPVIEFNGTIVVGFNEEQYQGAFL